MIHQIQWKYCKNFEYVYIIIKMIQNMKDQGEIENKNEQQALLTHISEQYYAEVQLRFACRNLVNANDPHIKLYIKQSFAKDLQFAGQTNPSVKSQTNPTWQVPIKVKYFFEFSQPIRIQIFSKDKKDSCLYDYESTLSEILNANDYIIDALKDPSDKDNEVGKIIIQIDRAIKSEYDLIMQWRGTQLKNIKSFFDCIDKDNPYLKFYKVRKNNTHAFVHETQPLFRSLEPLWHPFRIPLWKFFSCFVQDPLVKIQCLSREDNKNDQLIGEVYLSYSQLNNIPLKLNISNTKMFGNPGYLILQSLQKVPTPSFLDYIQCGLKIHLSLSIDLTGSNKPHTFPDSLHYIHPTNKDHRNQYQRIAEDIYNILGNYDYDKCIHVFGFGAKPNWPHFSSEEVSHCFPITGDHHKPYVKSIQEFHSQYKNCLQNVKLSGNTHFSQILKQIIKVAQMYDTSQNSFDYMVGLIITDGQIHDFQQTLQILSLNCWKPLSVIIIGIGGQDFDRMHLLDTYPYQRDYVQFIQANKYKSDKNLLASQLLSFIPNQVIDYMVRNKKVPIPVYKTQFTQIISVLKQNIA